MKWIVTREGVEDRILRSGRPSQRVIAGGVGVEPGLPELLEPTARMDTPQRQDVFGTGLTPEHARLFAASANDGLTPGFDHA